MEYLYFFEKQNKNFINTNPNTTNQLETREERKKKKKKKEKKKKGLRTNQGERCSWGRTRARWWNGRRRGKGGR